LKYIALKALPHGQQPGELFEESEAIGDVLIRVGHDTPEGALDAALSAAEICGTRVRVSDAASESDTDLLDRLGDVEIDRVRMLTEPSAELRAGLFERDIDIDCEPVSPSGRRELRRWLREQAVSRTAHRHGRVAP